MNMLYIYIYIYVKYKYMYIYIYLFILLCTGESNCTLVLDMYEQTAIFTQIQTMTRAKPHEQLKTWRGKHKGE